MDVYVPFREKGEVTNLSESGIDRDCCMIVRPPTYAAVMCARSLSQSFMVHAYACLRVKCYNGKRIVEVGICMLACTCNQIYVGEGAKLDACNRVLFVTAPLMLLYGAYPIELYTA